MHDVLILGAGPAGLAAALALGERAMILERAPHAGGLASSVELAGAVFDIGGHSLHTPHPQIRRLVEDALELYEQPRDARCFSHGRLIPYPFQKHFRELGDPRVVEECAAGLAARPPGPPPAHFGEFLQQRFGAGIARHFLLPYNRKLWGNDLTRLAADWVGERVAAPEGTEETFELSGGQRKPLQSNTRVAYPARGGFGAIWSALAARVRVRYGEQVVAIDPAERAVTTAQGERWHYRQLVSTLPLPVLLRSCRGVPAAVLAAAQQLEALPLAVVLLVLDHPVDTAIQRIYCADATVPAHKVAFNHNSSDYLRALPRHGIMAEISCVLASTPSDGELIRWTVQGLTRMGVLRDPDRIVASRVLDVPYAYPVPTLQRDRAVASAKQWLACAGIETVGRFGEWAYINSDEAMNRGFRLGARL